jgi:sigma-B regulation protein RsbU (phosphoserine phosphatase)
MLINRQGVKEILNLSGPAVGGNPDADYELREVVMQPGDAFFAYTDGITDTTNPSGEYFSEKDLIPLFAGNQVLSVLLSQIQKQIETFSAGVAQIDDITMLAVRRMKT